MFVLVFLLEQVVSGTLTIEVKAAEPSRGAEEVRRE
jgi:hypothetical protein